MMGWLADKNEQTDARLAAAVMPSVPAGESLQGVALANRQSTFSAKLYAMAATDHHLLLVPLDRALTPSATALVLRTDEIELSNIFEEGAGLAGFGRRGQEIRFTARGEKFKLMALGGNIVENALASEGQLAGLAAVAELLRRCRR